MNERRQSLSKEPMTILEYKHSMMVMTGMLFSYIMTSQKEEARNTIKNFEMLFESLKEIVEQL